jgi:YbbR domain-containing protein
MKSEQNAKKSPFHLLAYLFRTKMGTMIFSVVTAIIFWFFISINLYPTTLRTISHIPLTIDLTGTAAELNGYSEIEHNVEEVTVQIEGSRSQIGNLDVDDMLATPVIGNITSSGVKTLEISVASKDGTSFTVKSISPKTVNVRFDKLVTRTIPIQSDISRITSADSCIINTDEIRVTPSELEVSGPEDVLDQISYAVAVIPKERELSAAAILTTDQLEFRDENGVTVESTYLDYTLSNYAVEVPVQYTQELDLSYQLRNVPTNFDEAYLRSILTQSSDHITLAAPDSSLDAETAFSIGQISLSDIGLDFSKDYVLEIPEDYQNLSGITSVNLTLDSSELMEKEFVVTDIGIVNAPTTYDMSVDTSQLTVTMIGPKYQIEQLSAADLTVTVNLLGVTQLEGDTVSFSDTPTISCTKWDRVWAVGDYTNSVYVKGEKIDTVETDSIASET